MSKRSETRRWLERHRSDAYVRAARTDNYRSRAVYKLHEIDNRDRLLRGKRCIVDLGAAPGGWSEYCAAQCPGARIIALDRLAMAPVEGVELVQAEFAEQAGLDALLAALADAPADLVLSDMAPNLTGIKATDQAGVMQLAELALDLCSQTLATGGDLLLKVFQGAGFDPLLAHMRQCFSRVHVRKPRASRDASAETYLLGRAWRGRP